MSAGFIIAAIFAAVILVGMIVYAVVSGRAREAAWRQIAADVGGDYIPGRLFRSSKVVAPIKQGALTLETYSVPSGDSSTTYTRLRAPLQNPAGFQFTVFREGLIGKIDKALGMQDVEIGIAEFDDAFVVQSNDEGKVRALLSNARIRELVQVQRSIRLRLTKKNELVFEEQGVLRDVTRLRNLFALFGAILEQLAA